jgi:glycosyltransferase involved in cell wall biosynthesis
LLLKISVITAVYNGEAYLDQSVKSILAQTYKDMEYIIVNDGSTDRTASILDQVADPRVRIVHLKQNQGAANALNVAVQQSKGDWIAVQDADDLSLPNRLQVQSDYVKARPELVAAGSLIKSISGHQNLSPHHLRNVDGFYNSGVTRDELRDIRYERCPLCHGSVLFLKEAFLQAGGYDTSYKVTYDYDLWMRLFEIGEIDKIEAVLYQYRVHSASLSHSNWGVMLQEKLRSSLAAIRRQFAGKTAPRFIVFGESKHCKNFRKRIVPSIGIETLQYVTEQFNTRLSEACLLHKKGSIDGIIVLEGPMKKMLKASLLQAGLRINHHFFVL